MRKLEVETPSTVAFTRASTSQARRRLRKLALIPAPMAETAPSESRRWTRPEKVASG